ncbi:2-phospho-L-lactate transferase [Candidatus Bathyarchaeota archaeon]|nr:2-phospho-L-lactate transferase [Candidatus Bathyarchaeota archaeon]
MLVALAGGVGAARFLQGLVAIFPPENLTVIGNTGDDMEIYGLYVSPDLDIVTYTLAGLVDEAKGWGIKGDTFGFLDMLSRYGYETWFRIGDRDLATHLHRTMLLRKGLRLSEATADICRRLGVEVRLLPMTDDPVRTMIRTEAGTMHFQEYLVKRGARDAVLAVEFLGAKEAKPSPGILEAIQEAEGVIICPSNPIVSIGPILSIDGIRQALRRTRATVVGISPIIMGAPVKGPADKLMRGLGIEISAFGVASLYADILDTFIIDFRDSMLAKRIESELGVNVMATDTLMTSFEVKKRLAEAVLHSIRG